MNKIQSLPKNSVNNNWLKLVQSFNKYESKQIENDIQFVNEFYNSTKISWNCRKSIEKTLNSLKNLELFAYQMYDSWPTFPPQSILEGTVNSFGDYDQCVAIKPNHIIGSSQYCLITLQVPLPEPKSVHINVNHRVDHILPEYLANNNSSDHFFNKLAENAVFFYLIPLRIGLCLPNKCDINDVQILTQKVFENSGLNLNKIDCNTKTLINLNVMQMMALSLVIIFVLISIFATLFNKNRIKNPKCQQFLESFCLTKNTIRLMSTDSKPELSCIDGIRVLTMSYIIIAHTIEYTDWSLYKDTFRIKSSMNEWQNIPLSKVHTFVETFFLISGILVSYTTLKHKKYNQFNGLSYILLRIIRLFPLMAIFLVMTTLVPMINSGPIWNQYFEDRISFCYKNWWKNFLFIHNLIDGTEMCIGSTWFISTDMQFHILSFVVILAFLKKPSFGLLLNSFIIFLFSVLTAFIIIIMDFSPGRVSTQFGEYFMKDFLEVLYWKPWPHASVYFIGLAFGYLLSNSTFHLLTKTKRAIVWISIIIGYLVCIYDTYYWTFGAPNNKWISALLFPSTRILWALTTSTLIWMCVSGNGGIVNRVLSWSAFTPLSRLNYSVYMTHVWILWAYWGSRRQLPELYPSSVCLLIGYSIFVSYLLGFVFSLIFECPISFLQDYLKRLLFSNQNTNEINSNYKLTEISHQKS